MDVCIAGGGPAGVALALRLAQLGRSSAIIEKVAFPRTHQGESFTASVLPLFDVLGVRPAIEAAGLLRTEWATVHWAGELRRDRTHGGAGLLVDRGCFDSILLRAAAENSLVRVYQPARIASRVCRGDQWQITLKTGEVLYADHLADATGRARFLGTVKTPIGTPTLAIHACWKNAKERGEGDTLVEAGPSEWYWGAPLPNGEFNATVFVDPKAQPDKDRYFELIRRSKLLWPKLQNATVCSHVRVCDATPFMDQSPISRRSVNVGDAALSIDPLSSQGVETAIGTAMHAAVVINTMIDRPSDAEFAMDFYRSRIKKSAAFHAAAAGRFYKEQYDACGGSFWSHRAQAPTPEPRNTRVMPPIHPSTLVRIAPDVQFTTVPVVDRAYVIPQEGVMVNAKTIAYIGNGVGVAALLRKIRGVVPAVDIVQLWSTQMGVPEALKTLEWARAEGLVESIPIP